MQTKSAIVYQRKSGTSSNKSTMIFISVYCQQRHPSCTRTPAELGAQL